MLMALPPSTRRFVTVLSFLVALIGWGSPDAQAQSVMQSVVEAQPVTESPKVRAQALQDVAGTDGVGVDGPLRRVGFTLAHIHRSYESHRAAGKSVRSFAVASPSVRVRNGIVAIDAIAREGRTAELLGALEALGLRSGARAGRLVSGRLPIAVIPDAAVLPSLHTARPVLVRTSIGAVTSQGVEAMRSEALRTNLETDGSGIRVGILSDSYNNFDPARGRPLTDESQDISTGDLPGEGNPNGFTTPVDVLDEADEGESDEGRAMAQIIHDVAPGAEMTFHTAFDGLANFAQGIRDLADGGAQVVVDDVLFLAEPAFQDGLIAQAIDDVVFGENVTYVTAAGNTARQSYEQTSDFSGGEGPIDGGRLHDFDPGPGVDRWQTFFVPQSVTVDFSFQWAQPAASVGGRGAASDLEMVITDLNGNVIEAARRPNVGGNPFEFVTFTNRGQFDADGDGEPDKRFLIGFELVDGPPPPRLKYIYFTDRGGTRPLEHDTQSPTLYGHPNARGALTTSASFFETTPAFDDTPPLVNDFAAVAGVPVLFDEVGNQLAEPELRRKPELTGPDGVNTTFFGNRAGDGDAFPNFFGTSAAAPHVAGLAALILSVRPEYAPGDVLDVLQRSAIDIVESTDEQTVGEGFDPVSGAGLVQGDRVTLVDLEVAELQAVSTNGTQVEVSWTQSAGGIASYRLEQSFLGGAFETVATVTSTGPGAYSQTLDVETVGVYDYRLQWTRTDGSEDAGLRTRARRELQQAVAFRGPYPNPAPGAFTLEVTVPRRQGVIILLYDLLGRRLGTVFSDVVNADRPRFIRIDAEDARRFGAGRYFLRVVGEDFDEAVPVTIVR